MLKSLRRKIIGDLKANRGQFFAVWLVVTLGTTFYGAMYPAAINLVDSLYDTYDQLRYMDFQVALAEPAAPEALDAVRAIPGVAYVEGRRIVEAGLQVDPDQKYLLGLRLISMPDTGEAEVNRSAITSGGAISGPREILLLRAFANKHGIRPGDTLRLVVEGQTVEVRVAGLVFNPEYLVAGRSPVSPFPTPTTFGVAWMRFSDLDALAGRTGMISDVAVRLVGKSDADKGNREPSVRAALADLFPGAAIYTRIQTASGGVVDANINGNFPIMIFFSGLFLAGATVITGILLARLVESERRRIGTMRAMGVTRRELVIHYLSFGFLIGVSGGLVGSVLGYFNSFWFMYTWLDYVAGGTLPGFSNTPQIPFILLGFVIVVIGSTVSGAYPAWTQSATPPGIALRPATPRTPNALSRVTLGFLPMPARQAVRNLLRAPGRAVGTALGIMAGAMMLFSALALWDTMDINFDHYFASTAFDLRVDMNAFQPADALEREVQQIAGVEAAQAALVGPVTVTPRGGQPFDTAAVAVDEQNPFFDLATLEGERAFSRADGVWLGHNAQRVLGVHVGDPVTIQAFGQAHDVTVLGVVSQAVGSPVFVPRSLLAQWAPGGIFPANTVLLRAADGQASAVREAVIDLPGVQAVEVLDEFDGDLNHYLEYFRTNTLFFGSFGVILALALLFNTVNASLRERREELAVLRALGASGREIALTVTLEFLVMVALGALIGVPLGVVSGFYLNDAYQTDFFGQVNGVHMLSYGVGVVVLLLVVVLAEIPGLRAVQRADLGQVSKSQSF